MVNITLENIEEKFYTINFHDKISIICNYFAVKNYFFDEKLAKLYNLALLISYNGEYK